MPKEEGGEKGSIKYSIPKNKIENKEYKDYSKKTFGDFHEEFSGKICKIQVLNQSLLIGTVKEVRAYWIKVETVDHRILFINKAYVIQIEPVGKT
jgi:hypothetical protein